MNSTDSLDDQEIIKEINNIDNFKFTSFDNWVKNKFNLDSVDLNMTKLIDGDLNQRN